MITNQPQKMKDNSVSKPGTLHMQLTFLFSFLSSFKNMMISFLPAGRLFFPVVVWLRVAEANNRHTDKHKQQLRCCCSLIISLILCYSPQSFFYLTFYFFLLLSQTCWHQEAKSFSFLFFFFHKITSCDNSGRLSV